ncbi:MAG: transposon-encoded TnpW family protein [bacterium]|nr:transposon-encoded TnpW family protein [bacterium]
MKNTNYFYLTRRIGSTLYRVKIYLAENGTETMEDKLFRIIQNHPITSE